MPYTGSLKNVIIDRETLREEHKSEKEQYALLSACVAVIVGVISYQIVDWRWERSKAAEKERKLVEEEFEAERYAALYTNNIKAAGLENANDILEPSKIREFVINK